MLTEPQKEKRNDDTPQLSNWITNKIVSSRNVVGNPVINDIIRRTKVQQRKWNVNMLQLLGSKGLTGYIDGNIPKPATPSASTTTPDTTPIYSTKPNHNEWVFRDQLARGHVTLNCTDVAGLSVVTTRTAKDAWDSIQEEWGRSTDMRRLHAQE